MDDNIFLSIFQMNENHYHFEATRFEGLQRHIFCYNKGTPGFAVDIFLL